MTITKHYVVNKKVDFRRWKKIYTGEEERRLIEVTDDNAHSANELISFSDNKYCMGIYEKLPPWVVIITPQMIMNRRSPFDKSLKAKYNTSIKILSSVLDDYNIPNIMICRQVGVGVRPEDSREAIYLAWNLDSLNKSISAKWKLYSTIQANKKKDFIRFESDVVEE